MIALFEIVALLFGLGGLLMMSQATTGVGLIGFGCLLAILARLAQADAHHKATHPSAPQTRSIPVIK